MNIKASTEEKIRWQNSLTNAQSLSSALIPFREGVTVEVLKTTIEDLSNWFYNIEPKVTEIDKEIESCKTLEQLELLKDAVKFTDSIKTYNLWNAAKIKLS